MMANRFGDLSPSSSRAYGLQEENGENAGNEKELADEDCQQANLKKALEMPMYDNEDLASDKIEDSDARAPQTQGLKLHPSTEVQNRYEFENDEEGSPNLNENDGVASESEANLQGAIDDSIENVSASLPEANEVPVNNHDVLAKLQLANNHYYDGEDSAEDVQSDVSPASRLASLEPKSRAEREADLDEEEGETN